MVGKENLGGFEVPHERVYPRIKGDLEVSFEKGARVRIQKPGDDRHNHIGNVEFISEDHPTVYGVRFQPGGTGEFFHSELVGVGFPKEDKYGFKDASEAGRKFAEAVGYEKEDRPAELKKTRTNNPQAQAIALVRVLYYPHVPVEEFYVVWFCYTVGNWKALVSTNVKDNRYFEVTHNGAKAETYVDMYVKQEHMAIHDDLLEDPAFN